jgi:hypothetical protein
MSLILVLVLVGAIILSPVVVWWLLGCYVNGTGRSRGL